MLVFNEAMLSYSGVKVSKATILLPGIKSFTALDACTKKKKNHMESARFNKAM